MVELYLYLLTAICLGLLGWGLAKPERVYQYPFFMGGIFTAFILPQAIALINHPGAATSSSITRILLYASLCAATCWLGYNLRPRTQWLSQADNIPVPKKLVHAGLLLVIFGVGCTLILSRITIQTTASGTWTGPATILAFFSGTTWTGMSILLLHGLYYRRLQSLIFAGLALPNILTVVLEAGRRQPTATFVIILGLSLFFTRRITPPRWLVIALIVLTMSLIPLIGQMRGAFWDTLFAGNLTLEDLGFAFDQLQKGRVLELRNAALVAEGATLTGQYGYGTGFWNSIVFQYIPGQWLGYNFKESLYIHLTSYDLQELFNYKSSTGSTLTGIGDSFREFSYFGCLLFGVIAYAFKHIWISAIYRSNFYSRILYMGLVSPALLSLTHGIGRFLQEAIFEVIIVSLVAHYSQRKVRPYILAPVPESSKSLS